MFLPARLALCSVFVLSASTFCHAEPTSPIPVTESPTTPSNLAEATHIEPLTVDGELRLNIEIHRGNVVGALGEIAQKGNLQVVVKAGVDGVVNNMVSTKAWEPEMALQRVCQAAGIDCQLKEGIWFISPKKAADADTFKAKFLDSMVFSGVEVKSLLQMLADQFDLAIAIAGNVEGKIPFLRIQNKTPRQALDAICLAADLQVKEVGDGTLIVTKKQP